MCVCVSVFENCKCSYLFMSVFFNLFICWFVCGMSGCVGGWSAWRVGGGGEGCSGFIV
jgi:hypothetical protein